jgi:hypothetical protein
MKNWKVKFSSQTVSFFLEGNFAAINNMVDKTNAFYITDENVYALHQKKFKNQSKHFWSSVREKAFAAKFIISEQLI